MKLIIIYNSFSKITDLFSDLIYLLFFPHMSIWSSVILVLMILWPYLILYYVDDLLKINTGIEVENSESENQELINYDVNNANKGTDDDSSDILADNGSGNEFNDDLVDKGSSDDFSEDHADNFSSSEYSEEPIEKTKFVEKLKNYYFGGY